MRARFAIVLLISCMEAGCAVQRAAPVGSLPQRQVIETVETDADRLLNYYAYMTGLQGDILLQEYQRVQEAYHTDPSDFYRMQLIMLLSSPSASFRDMELARFLLEGWLKEEYNTYSKLHPLALLYDSYLSELTSRDETIVRTSSQLSETSKQIEQQSAQISEQKSALARETQRSRELQEKLDALLEMEKNLIERGQK